MPFHHTTATTTVLITGAHRGVGRALLDAYLARPYHLVIAAVPDPHALYLPGAADVDHIPRNPHSALLVVALDRASPASTAAAVAELTAARGITSLDLVVANATDLGGDEEEEEDEEEGKEDEQVAGGLPAAASAASAATPGRLRRLADVNAYGPLELFRAVLPLMGTAAEEKRKRAEEKEEVAGEEGREKKERPKRPQFALVSAAVGSFGVVPGPKGFGPYGASKALANYLFRWLAEENEGVLVSAIHPGAVKADLDAASKLRPDLQKIEVPTQWNTVEEKVQAIQKVIDEAEQKSLGGRFIQYDGTEAPW